MWSKDEANEFDKLWNHPVMRKAVETVKRKMEPSTEANAIPAGVDLKAADSRVLGYYIGHIETLRNLEAFAQYREPVQMPDHFTDFEDEEQK